MQSIQVANLKSDFSSILREVQEKGEKYVIEYGKNHKKIAMLIPYDDSLQKGESRSFGILKGKGDFAMRGDFAMSDEELLGL